MWRRRSLFAIVAIPTSSRAFLLVRAHVPVDRPRPRPDGFRRGDRAARWGKQTDLMGDRSGRLLRVDPASGLPLPRPVRVAAVDEIRHRLDRAAIVPALGFASFRVVGHARDVLRPVVRARVRARPRMPRHRPPASRVSRAPIRSWALRRSFPVERSSRRAAVGTCSPCRGCLSSRRNRLPFSVLWGRCLVDPMNLAIRRIDSLSEVRAPSVKRYVSI